MKFFNVIIFLLSISISALTIPSMMPNISMLAVFLLSVALMFNVFFQNNDAESMIHGFNTPSTMNFSNLTIPFMVLFLLFLFLFFNSFNIHSNIYANVNLFVLHFLFLLFLVHTKNLIVLYIKAYILLAVVMSTCGVLAQLIVEVGLNPDGSYVNLGELTHGAFSRDRGNEFSYLFPYKLGFILTGDGTFNFGSFNFYRISGWAHEPTSATLFIAPAIILLLHSRIIQKNFYRYLALTPLVIFWIFAMAVGSLLAFMILYGFVVLTTLYIKYFPKKLSLILLVGIIVFVPFLIYFHERVFSTELLMSKFSFESHTMSVAIENLTWFMPDSDKTVAYYLTHLVLWVNIFLFIYVAINGIITRKFIDVNSLVLLYLVLHTMKGSQESVFVLIFMFFWFYVAYFSIGYSKKNVIV